MNVGELMPAKAFKLLSAQAQRKAIADMFKALSVGDANAVHFWVHECAPDLLNEESHFAAAFDAWYITTKVYDVEIPQDVFECIAESESAVHWNRMITRHNFPWRKGTGRDLREMGII